MLGANFGPGLMSAVGIKDTIARGLAAAGTAGGLGTASLTAKVGFGSLLAPATHFCSCLTAFKSCLQPCTHPASHIGCQFHSRTLMP